jgi:hypothetical protein
VDEGCICGGMQLIEERIPRAYIWGERRLHTKGSWLVLSEA